MYADAATVRQARGEYFAANGFSDAGYTDDWVTLKLGPIPITFPNTASRKRAIPLHDLHHVATGYGTTWLGEAEIAAWEVGGGCTDHWAAWVLNLGGMSYGAVLAPRRVFRAFVRGRRSRNLYHAGWDDSLLELSVGELRRRLAVTAELPPATARDRLAFAGWLALANAPVVIAAGVLVALLT